MRQRALRAAALLRAHLRDLGDLARIERLLELRETQPDQRVQQVMPIARAGGNLAARGNALFVMQAIGEQRGGLCDEARRAFGGYARVQRGDVRPRTTQELIEFAPER